MLEGQTRDFFDDSEQSTPEYKSELEAQQSTKQQEQRAEFFDKLINKTQEDLAAKEDMAQVTRQGMAIPPDMPMPQAQGMACGGEARKR